MKTTRLKQLYEEFLSLPFPQERHEALMDWIAELAEIDGYYAGLAETLIADNPILRLELPSLDPLFDDLKKLRHQPGISENQYLKYEHYLLALKRLANEIEETIKKQASRGT